MKIILKYIAGFLVILLASWMLHSVVKAKLVQECHGWVAEYNEFRDSSIYYWTDWQVDQCKDLIGYEFNGNIK